MTNEDGQKSHLIETTEIGTFRDEAVSQMDRMPLQMNPPFPPKVWEVGQTVNYRFTVIRRPYDRIFHDHEVYPFDVYAQMMGLPMEVCIPIFVHKGEPENERELRARHKLLEKVGVNAAPIYEVDVVLP